MSMDKKSILDMAMGAFKERADYEMSKIIDNITDPNTKADKKRSLTVTIDILPDAERQNLRITTTVKSKLEPTNPVSTALYITPDSNGDAMVVEMIPQIPGQMNMDSEEQSEPAILRLVKNA